MKEVSAGPLVLLACSCWPFLLLALSGLVVVAGLTSSVPALEVSGGKPCMLSCCCADSDLGRIPPWLVQCALYVPMFFYMAGHYHAHKCLPYMHSTKVNYIDHGVYAIMTYPVRCQRLQVPFPTFPSTAGHACLVVKQLRRVDVREANLLCYLGECLARRFFCM